MENNCRCCYSCYENDNRYRQRQQYSCCCSHKNNAVIPQSTAVMVPSPPVTIIRNDSDDDDSDEPVVDLKAIVSGVAGGFIVGLLLVATPFIRSRRRNFGS